MEYIYTRYTNIYIYIYLFMHTVWYFSTSMDGINHEKWGGVLQSRFNHYLALQVVRTELVNVGGEFEHHLILRSPADLSAQC